MHGAATGPLYVERSWRAGLGPGPTDADSLAKTCSTTSLPPGYEDCETEPSPPSYSATHVEPTAPVRRVCCQGYSERSCSLSPCDLPSFPCICHYYRFFDRDLYSVSCSLNWKKTPTRSHSNLCLTCEHRMFRCLMNMRLHPRSWRRMFSTPVLLKGLRTRANMHLRLPHS